MTVNCRSAQCWTSEESVIWMGRSGIRCKRRVLSVFWNDEDDFKYCFSASVEFKFEFEFVYKCGEKIVTETDERKKLDTQILTRGYTLQDNNGYNYHYNCSVNESAKVHMRTIK